MRWIDRFRGDKALMVDTMLLATFICLLLAVLVGVQLLLLRSVVCAQEVYITPEGSGLIVETYPGVRYYTGPIQGMSVETYPGITRYDLEAPDGRRIEGMRYELGPVRERDREPPWAETGWSSSHARPWWEGKR